MARTKGKVIGTAGDGWARLIIERTSACSGCQTTHKFHSCLSHVKTEARALNGVGAKTGDLVSVSINTETLLKSAAILS
jgi:positive regulator of sigma E activity